MFLDALQRRNPAFVRALAELHQRQQLPANTLALDLEAIRHNASLIAGAAARLNLEVFAMTKQVGRHPDFAAALRSGGIASTVAVDMDCAAANASCGMRLGNIGHLVQVPAGEARHASALEPANWTVFNLEKAAEAAAAADAHGRTQDLLLRVYADGDTFYPGHEGGFSIGDLPRVLDELSKLRGVRVAGVTTFPALVFDQGDDSLRLTPNVRTLCRAAELLRAAGIADVRINAPGTTSSVALELLADAGATQVEPGHGLTGTTPLHARQDLPELPAAAYVSEVSHHHGGRAYFFGGGLYVDPVFPAYEPKAIVFAPGDPDPVVVQAHLPSPQMIDYYGQLEPAGGALPPVGATVILGFRFQTFVTRARVAGVDAVSADPRVATIATPMFGAPPSADREVTSGVH